MNGMGRKARYEPLHKLAVQTLLSRWAHELAAVVFSVLLAFADCITATRAGTVAGSFVKGEEGSVDEINKHCWW